MRLRRWMVAGWSCPAAMTSSSMPWFVRAVGRLGDFGERVRRSGRKPALGAGRCDLVRGGVPRLQRSRHRHAAAFTVAP